MRHTTRARLRRIAVLGLLCMSLLLGAHYMSLLDGLTSNSPKGVQMSKKSFADTLKVSSRVVKNSQDNGAYHIREVTLTNTGTVAFPSKGWDIFFTQIYGPEIGGLGNSNILLSHVQGQVYKFSPMPRFSPIPPGGVHTFRYQSVGNSVVYTDGFPNWYLVLEGGKPRVLASTQGDPAQFSKVQDTPQTWKSEADRNMPTFDHHNPPTSSDRFIRDSTLNLLGDPLPIIPQPLEIRGLRRNENINMHHATWVIVGSPSFHSEMEFLADAWQLKMSADVPSDHCINFLQGPVKLSGHKDTVHHSDEAYSLQVSPSTNTITVTASKPAGAFYAVQSLIDLRDREGRLPLVTIVDAPRFTYRGLMLDIARNFHSKETIKRLIRLMAMYKLNKLHLHLSDDEGWRIEIPGLEELTAVGSRRCHDVSERQCLLPFLGSGPDVKSSGTGYLTVSDYRELLSYAVRHHIEVIPEIDVPGHAHAAIVAMKQRHINTGSSEYLLTDPRDASFYQSIQGFTDNAINPCMNSTYAFLQKVITEIYNMHRGISPLSRFHFGGDEVPGSAWRNSPACKALAQEYDGERLSQIFLHRVSAIIDSLGMDVAAWEDGFKMEGNVNLPREMFKQKNVYAYSWKNPPHLNLLKSAYTMANSGYKVVLASATNLYLDHPQDPDPAERGLVWATRFINTRRTFFYSPLHLYSSTNVDIRGKAVEPCFNVPDKCPSLDRPEDVEGMEAVLFGELITSTQILDFMLLPRLLAVAERAWHEAEWEQLVPGRQRKSLQQVDWTNFANTLGHRELPKLDRLGYQYRIPPPGGLLDPQDKSRLLVNVTYPGHHTVEISRNGGWGWADAPEAGLKVEPGERILLRTKAGTRHSRTVSLSPSRAFDIED